MLLPALRTVAACSVEGIRNVITLSQSKVDSLAFGPLGLLIVLIYLSEEAKHVLLFQLKPVTVRHSYHVVFAIEARYVL